MSHLTTKPPRQLLSEEAKNDAVRDLLNTFAAGVSILVARTTMSAAGWGGLWPDWVADARPGSGTLDADLTQKWIKHILTPVHMQNAQATTEPVAHADCRRCNSYATLVKSLETQLSTHRANARKYAEAAATLDSERAANSQLTLQIEQLTNALLSDSSLVRYSFDPTGVEEADSHGDFLKVVDALPFIVRAQACDEDTIRDAASWRSLLGSARIRTLGSAGIVRPEPNNYAHMGLEIWTKYDTSGSEHDFAKENDVAKSWLDTFVRVAAAAQAEALLTGAPSAAAAT